MAQVLSDLAPGRALLFGGFGLEVPELVWVQPLSGQCLGGVGGERTASAGSLWSSMVLTATGDQAFDGAVRRNPLSTSVARTC